jgi:uncharacterized membrane protein YqjE
VPDRSFAASITDIKEDLKVFFQTRVQLLRAETGEKLRSWKRHLILLGLAALFLLSGWMALVFTIVALLHTWISGSTYAWFWGGLIVSAVFLAAGAACAKSGYQGIKFSGMMPARTLKVLRQDQEWIQKQARPA